MCWMIWSPRRVSYTTNKLRYSTGILFFPALLACIPAHSQGGHDTSITVYFGEASFRPDNGQLRRIDSFFYSHQGAFIKEIEGHTDTIGETAYNKALSRKRSGAVSGYLQGRWRLAPGYPVMNYGEERPVSATDNALNRRVEIRVGLADGKLATAESPGMNRKGGRGEPVTTGRDSVVMRKIQLDRLYFQPDEAVLESSSLSYIHGMALVLKKYDQAIFEIRGHVNCPLDVKPGSGYMQKMNQLSADRARAVYDLLIDAGVPADRMRYKGLGNTEMVYPYAANEEEKRKNMRVEIFVIQTSSAQPSP
jgi:outer membrane protein OmpA-like peptidoglycan-associated protein